MKIGFTGTRHGMTSIQKKALLTCMSRYLARSSQFMHGDCIGADKEAHSIVRRAFPSVHIVIAPSSNGNLRAYCEGDTVREPEQPLVRNAQIVYASDRMFACPAEFEEQSRGGTWFTIRVARKAKKPLTIIYPDGSTSNA